MPVSQRLFKTLNVVVSEQMSLKTVISHFIPMRTLHLRRVVDYNEITAM